MIAVIMSSYDRQALAKRCCEALLENLKADEPIQIRIADDSSHDQSYLGAWRHVGLISNYTIAERRGIGGSLNKALGALYGDPHRRNDLWLYTTDDWLLTRELDIQPAVELIRGHDYDYVRLGPIHPDLTCKTRFHAPIGWWLQLDATKGGFAFATRPFLASANLHAAVGSFAEYEDAYVTEQDFAERVGRCYSLHSRLGAIVPHGLHGPWEHIGAEYNDDPEHMGRIAPAKPVVAHA